MTQNNLDYENLINPANLLSLEEVESFCDLAECREDLEAFMERCEEEELYEYCSIIKRKLHDFDRN